MKTFFSRIAFVTMLWALSLTAWASSSASLIIHNGFVGENRVYIDGRYHGIVPSGGDAAYAMEPGIHAVRVVRPGGYAMVDTQVHLRIGRATNVHVVAPLSKLQLTNTGIVPLRVDLDPGSEVWLGAGQTAVMTVPSGRIKLTSSMRLHAGDIELEQRSVWVEPGQVTKAQVRANGEVNRTLVVTNFHARTVRVLVGGKDKGRLEPGRSLRMNLASADTRVQLIEIGGVIAYSGRVNLYRGQETRLILERRHDVQLVRSANPNSAEVMWAYRGPTSVQTSLGFRW